MELDSLSCNGVSKIVRKGMQTIDVSGEVYLLL